MVIIPDIKKIFLHVPRTGGMAVSLALNEQYPNALVDLTIKFIHAPRSYFGESWRGYEFVAVMRSPWDIYSSHMRWCRLISETDPGSQTDIRTDRALRGYANLALKLEFSQAIKSAIEGSHVCREPGFHATYCDQDTRIVMYGDHERELSEIFQCNLHMQRINSVPPIPRDSAWDEESIALVARQCRDDIERFGFQPPERVG